MIDQRLQAPSAQRNRDPILEVLRHVLPKSGTVLEIASGSGEHVIHFARALPDITFQPSDMSVDSLKSIAAWVSSSAVPNILPPLHLDVTQDIWPVSAVQAVLCINMIHISPWAATQALMTGAAKGLTPGGVLYLYGPYKRGQQHTAPSNAAFDADLRARNPSWGVRDLDDVAACAAAAGFSAPDIFEMPANNHSVVFRRR
jgi:cyclopropane fatty-acyl-phospholipid synthase-like methyltransferase